MKNSAILLLLVFMTFHNVIKSLPNGAPPTACLHLLPIHGKVAPQNSSSPFTLKPSSTTIGQGQTLRLDIVATPQQLAFGGIILHAKSVSRPSLTIGKFLELSLDKLKLMHCSIENDTVTHISTTPKLDASVEWVAPLDFEGDIVFNATIAQKYDVFWVGISSEPVKVVRATRAAYPPGISSTRRPITTTNTVYFPTSRPTSKNVDLIYNGCGVSKTCFGIPDGCVQTESCSIIVTVNVRGDIYEFELKSFYQNQAYAAVALSTDDQMGDDSVMECFVQGGSVALRSSWTNPRPQLGVTRQAVAQNNVNLVSSSYVNGVINCKFDRDAVSVVKGRTFDLQRTPYNLLLAAGSEVRENSVGYHDLGRLPASQSFLLSEVQTLSGASNLFLRLHGAFMIVAWIGTTSLGIVLARYFKKTWVGSQLCGKDQWFAWHRICMVLTWALTMAAFVLIFVHLKGWSYDDNPHAIIGVITTVVCFFQPLGALFRPDPSSKNRPYFNWIHWLGGNFAHIMAIVAIFFAAKLEKAELPGWIDWILVAFVAFHVLMHLILSIIVCAAERKDNNRTNSFAMSDMQHGRSYPKTNETQDAPLTFFRKLLLGIYIFVLILFVIALVLIVVLAPIDKKIEETLFTMKEG